MPSNEPQADKLDRPFERMTAKKSYANDPQVLYVLYAAQESASHIRTLRRLSWLSLCVWLTAMAAFASMPRPGSEHALTAATVTAIWAAYMAFKWFGLRRLLRLRRELFAHIKQEAALYGPSSRAAYLARQLDID